MNSVLAILVVIVLVGLLVYSWTEERKQIERRSQASGDEDILGVERNHVRP